MADVKEQNRGVRKGRIGVVVSKSGNKSIVVEVQRRKSHPLYGKTVRHFKRLHAHDEKNEASLGDKVRIVETRPMSHLKRWRLVNVVEKGPDVL